jgi:WD40 repeat protein
LLSIRNLAKGSSVKVLERYSGQGHLRTIALSPDGHTLVWPHPMEGSLQVWNAATGKSEQTWEGHPKRQIYALAFSPDGKTLASGDEDGLIKLWDLSSGALLQSRQTEQNRVSTLAYHPDGITLAFGGY